MREDVDKCKLMRKRSKTAVRNSVWKLVLNALYGKTLESWRNRLKCKITTTRDAMKISMASIFSDSFKILDEFSFQETLTNNKVLFFGNGADKFKPLVQSVVNAQFIDDVSPSAWAIGNYKKWVLRFYIICFSAN